MILLLTRGQVGGIDDPGDLLQPAGDPGGAELQQIVPFFHQRLLAEPEQADAQPGGHLRLGLARHRRQLSARDVNLFRQGKPGGTPGARLDQRRLVESLDGADRAALARGIKDHFVAHPQAAGRHRAGDDAAVIALGGELVDVLHRHPERLVHCGAFGREPIQRLEDGGAGVPRHGAAAAGDVVALPAGRGDETGGMDPDLVEKGAVFADDARRMVPGRIPRDPSC